MDFWARCTRREKGGRQEKMPGHGDSPESKPTSVALPGRRNLPLTFGSFAEFSRNFCNWPKLAKVGAQQCSSLLHLHPRFTRILVRHTQPPAYLNYNETPSTAYVFAGRLRPRVWQTSWPSCKLEVRVEDANGLTA